MEENINITILPGKGFPTRDSIAIAIMMKMGVNLFDKKMPEIIEAVYKTTDAILEERERIIDERETKDE